MFLLVNRADRGSVYRSTRSGASPPGSPLKAGWNCRPMRVQIWSLSEVAVPWQNRSSSRRISWAKS